MDYIEFLNAHHVLKDFAREIDAVIDHYEENGSFQDINPDNIFTVLDWYDKGDRFIIIQVRFVETLNPSILVIELNVKIDDLYIIDEVEDTEFTIDDLKYLKNQLEIELVMYEDRKPRLGRL